MNQKSEVFTKIVMADKTTFRCEDCGGVVFYKVKKDGKDLYECVACGQLYEAEK